MSHFFQFVMKLKTKNTPACMYIFGYFTHLTLVLARVVYPN